jgi:DNA-binding SARP family transcriptional activator
VGAENPNSGGLFVHLLGEIAVLRDGVPQALPASKKTRALLGYLVASRSAQTRQRLCDLLWDGPDDPRAALRWSLTKLRPIVDDETAARLVADRDRVGFEPLGAHVDLFEAATIVGTDLASATAEALRHAAGLLRGDFLEGLELPDCYRFHEWCTAERERFRALKLTVLAALVERLDAAPEEALAYARQRLTTDPLSDVAHAAVVRLLARLDRRAEALAQVETCKRILERELGGRRSPVLELARLEIGRSDSVSVPVPDSRRATPEHTSKHTPEHAPEHTQKHPREQDRPLVGREHEREVLGDLVASVTSGRSSELVLLSGEPGIGKSRLLEDLAARVREARGLVLEARAFEAEAIRPYGIWMDILRDPRVAPFLGPHRADLAPLLPELGESPNDPETKARLFDGVARLLRDLSATAPVVLVVDDVHWLDEASSGLLHYVARVLQETRVGIACAARDGELSDNPAAFRFVRALRREGRLVTLPIEPLDARAIGQLLQLSADEDVARIFRESGGNPLFAIEVARSETEKANDEDIKRRPLDVLLEERLSRLEGRARDLVVWAAALGRQFDPALLVELTGDNLAQTIGAIGDLESSGLLASHDGTTYAFTHELIRKAAYRQLSGPRRRLVHLTIARALEGARDAWGDVVHHASLADDAELVARACVAAGGRCLRMAARRHAKDFAERGLVHAKRLGLEEGIHLRAELVQIAAFSAAAGPAKRQAIEDEAAEVARAARELGKAEDEATALFVLSLLTSSRADFDRAEKTTLRQAAAARGADPAASVPAIANTAFCLAFIEREMPKARALLDEAADLAATHRLSVIDLDLAGGMLAHFEGDLSGARPLLRRSASSSRSAGDYWRESVSLIRLAMVNLECEAWDETQACAAELRAVASKLGDGVEGITADVLDALAVHAKARGPDARTRLLETVRALELADAKALLSFALTTAAENELRAGDLPHAAELAERALKAAEVIGKPSATIRAHVALGRAIPGSAAAHLAAAQSLIDHPFGISRAARDRVDELSVDSNARTNAGPNRLRSKRKKPAIAH